MPPKIVKALQAKLAAARAAIRIAKAAALKAAAAAKVGKGAAPKVKIGKAKYQTFILGYRKVFIRLHILMGMVRAPFSYRPPRRAGAAGAAGP